MPYCSRLRTKLFDNRWDPKLLGHGSLPTLTLFHFPTFHANPSPITSNEWTISFQIIDATWWIFEGHLIHFLKESDWIYLLVTTRVQIFSMEISLQTNLASRALPNRKIFFGPHHPVDFGRAKEDHFTHGIMTFSWFLAHKNFEHSFLILSRIPFGIQSKDIQ
jgi:hypothetical protein